MIKVSRDDDPRPLIIYDLTIISLFSVSVDNVDCALVAFHKRCFLHSSFLRLISFQ